MTDLVTRVRKGLGSEWTPTHSSWAGLMRLYEADREAFYLLACDCLSDGDEVTRSLADLAQRVRAAVRSTYRIDLHDGSGNATIKTHSGETLTVPGSLFASVKSFLLEIDGKRVGDKPGKDYEGRPVSEAEVRFKLGETAGWEGGRPFSHRFRSHVEPAIHPVERSDEEEMNQPGAIDRGTRKKKVRETSSVEAEGAALRGELARDLLRTASNSSHLVGDASLDTHLALLLQDLSGCYKPLGEYASEANFLSIVALVEMALTGKKSRAFDRPYLETIRDALEIGQRKTYVDYEDVERVRELFRMKQIDTVPRIDLLSLTPEDLEDDDE